MARFADPKLQLAMIDEVYRRREGYDWVAGYRGRYEATGPARSWEDLEAGEPVHAPELEAVLAALPIDDDDLLGVDRLTLDGDRDLYAWVFPDWWDAGDHFTIRDLSGIERCARLEYLLLGQGLVAGASLAPLTHLPCLAELHLCALGGHRELDALVGIPALRTLDVVNVATSDDRAAWEDVIARLRARGVVVARR